MSARDDAGHNRPFVRRASGAVERVDGKGGRFVGMFPECEYRVRQLALGPGDMLFLYTDTHVPLAECPVGGLGILMTKRLVDVVHYRREHGRNILSLVKLDA